MPGADGKAKGEVRRPIWKSFHLSVKLDGNLEAVEVRISNQNLR